MQRLIPLYADNCNSIVFFSAQAFIVLFCSVKDRVRS